MTRHATTVIALASLAAWPAPIHAQTTRVVAPATRAAVGPFAVTIVRRAEAFLPSRAQWNRLDTGRCPRTDTTYSVRCALRRAIVEAAGLSWKPAPAVPGARASAPPLACSMDVSADHPGGTCGTLWDELPVFILTSAPSVKTGAWRKDAKPTHVWVGTMADAEGPVDYESGHGPSMVAQRKARDPVIDFNNDSTTTFEHVQAYFRELEARVLTQGAADLDQSYDDVEIEFYEGGTGVMRTYNGWFVVSGLSVRGSAIQFQIDTSKEVAPNALDAEILKRASAIISSDSVWNRADNRKCPAGATKWSIYCAVEQAQMELVGAFHHRRPAGELLREVVDDRTKDRNYHHRMMDYNNDPTTTLADVRSLFAEAIARIKS